MVMIGIDLHSNCFSACMIYDDGEKVKKEFDLNADSLKQFYEYLNPDTFVLVEASTNTFKFTELFIFLISLQQGALTISLLSAVIPRKQTLRKQRQNFSSLFWNDSHPIQSFLMKRSGILSQKRQGSQDRNNIQNG